MRTLRYAAMLVALFVAPAVYSTWTNQMTNQTPFVLKVVDQKGQVVPHVQVSTDNGIVCHTSNAGTVTWTESSLMNRRVRFSVDTPGYNLSDGKVFVMHGRRVELKVTHTSS